MSDLERHVAPLLTPMARGKAIEVATEDQIVIARWALKTALLFQYVLKHEEGVNPAFAHGLYEHLERAFPATYVWIASCDPGNATANFRSRNLWPAEVGIIGQAHGFVAAIRLHGVILLAYMHTLPTRTVEITGPSFRALIPAEGTLVWPLPFFPADEFNSLTEAFIGEPPTD